MTEQERAAALADGMEYDVRIGRYPRDETHDLIVRALRLLAAAPAAPPVVPDKMVDGIIDEMRRIRNMYMPALEAVLKKEPTND